MQCPVCRAENREGSECRRCKVDLSLLRLLEQQRQRMISSAKQELAQGNGDLVVEHARKAAAIFEDQEARLLLAMGHLLRRDFIATWRALRMTRDSNTN